MSDFVIRKDIYGNWWHDYNNDATKINISDFEALIDDVQNTFIIQCKNGSNVPSKAVSIADVKVIDQNISETPIAFSGAIGLKNLLTTLNYTPYVTSGGGGGGESLAETLAIDNKTNDIPIVSNNGMARVYVNDDYVQIQYDNDYLILHPTLGLLLQANIKVYTAAPEMEVVIGGTISYTCPSFLLNTQEVATQLWVTSQGYGTGTVTSVTGDLVDNTDSSNPIIETPNLTQVLTVGDKAPDSISGDRTWQPADRLKYWQVLSGIQTLDDTVFPDGSLIEGVIQNDDINATVTFDFDSANCFYLDQNITTLTLNVGDFFQLKHFSGGAWILTVANKSIGSVDSVNGQTGVVVLDTSDIADTTNKRYVTDAQLVVIANTSNTNSGDNATNTKYEAVARTGAVVAFDVDAVYNSIASPSSSNLTDDLTGARLKIVQKIYHNAGTAPTVPAGWVRRGTGTYVTSTLNIIYAEWSVGTTVEYWITQ